MVSTLDEVEVATEGSTDCSPELPLHAPTRIREDKSKTRSGDRLFAILLNIPRQECTSMLMDLRLIALCTEFGEKDQAWAAGGRGLEECCVMLVR